jgi:hypothetical protein
MQTPLQRLLRETPDYTFFKIFGCACRPHIRQYNNHKLEFRSKKCVFLGYSSLHKGYKCLHVPSNRVYISRDVIFDEHIFPFANLPTSNTLPVTESSLLLADQFMDTAYAPSLLANHGAGVGRGARLELLTPEASTAPPVHVDPVHGVASGPMPMHGSATYEPRTSLPGVAPCAPRLASLHLLCSCKGWLRILYMARLSLLLRRLLVLHLSHLGLMLHRVCLHLPLCSHLLLRHRHLLLLRTLCLLLVVSVELFKRRYVLMVLLP